MARLIGRGGAAWDVSVRDPSPVLGTVLSNLVPLVGVVLLGWNALTFVAVYWADIVVTGFWGACRTLVAAGRVETGGGSETGPTVRRRNVPEAVSTLGKTWKLAGFVGIPLAVVFVLTGPPGSGVPRLSHAQFALGVVGLVIGRGIDFGGYLSRGRIGRRFRVVGSRTRASTSRPRSRSPWSASTIRRSSGDRSRY